MTQDTDDYKKMQELMETMELCDKRYCPFKQNSPREEQCDGLYCEEAFESWKDEQ